MVVFSRFTTPLVVLVAALFSLWIGNSIFTYFSYDVSPEVRVVGLTNGDYHKGLISCSLRADNAYKIAGVCAMLDGKPFIIDGATSVRSQKFNLPFEIDTSDLLDGKHVLEIDAVDSSYHANKNSELVEFFVDNKLLKAAFLQPEYRVDQGHTLHPKIQLNKNVSSIELTFLSKKFNGYPDADDSVVYESFLPVDCEQNSGEFSLQAKVTDRVGNQVMLSGTVKINKLNFPRQKGFHVAAEKLEEEKEVSMNNKILSQALEKWVLQSPKKKLWNGPFELPTQVLRYSTPYGEIRVTPEKGRYLHRAVDIVNHPRSVVWASQNGKVIIKDRYLMSGNTVVVDHGLGVFTKYFHLDDFADIEVGEMIKKGSPVGKLGMTGYANGYHLHWGLEINNAAVNPIEWTKKVF